MTKFRVTRLPYPDDPAASVARDTFSADVGELSQAGALVFYNQDGPGLHRTLVCMYAGGQWLHVEVVP